MKKRVALVDADTIIFRSAVVIQESPLLVTHKINTKRSKEFRNITAFREWLSKNTGYSEDDFSIEENPRLVEPLENALHSIKLQVEKIANQEWCSDFRLYLGTSNNFRKTLYPYYKANRKAGKPIAFNDCYQYAVDKWKDRVIICDGEEAEDRVSIAAFEDYTKAKKARDKEASSIVVAGIDKDLDMLEGFRFNYDKPELGIWWVDNVAAFRAFCKQMCYGDATDNIKGLEGTGKDSKLKYGIKHQTIGKKTAEKLFDHLETEKEMFSLLVELFKDYYREGWQEKMTENGILLRLRKREGEIFNVVDFCKERKWESLLT